MCFVALTLDLFQENVPRREEIQGFQAPKVLSRMLLQEGKLRGLGVPKICLLRIDDMESSLEWGEQWWSDEKENTLVLLVFKVDRDLEDKASGDEATLESKSKNYSSFLTRSFDVVVIMFFIWRQDKNSEYADEYD